MAEYVINLPPVGDVVEASITLRTGVKATAKSVDLEDLVDVPYVEIEGSMRYVPGHKPSAWRGHDIAKMFAAYPEHVDVQAIVPLWQRWGRHAQQNFTRVQKEALESANRGGRVTKETLQAALKTADRGHVYGAQELVDPLDAGVFDTIVSVFEKAVK